MQPLVSTVVSGIRTAACVFAVAATLLGSSAPLLAQTQVPAQSAAPAAIAPIPREVTDETGRSIQIPQSIHRIVSLAPSITETLYALGLQDLLVGDTDYCDFPPAARLKPKVGGAINPSLEAIAALHPDLVLVTKSLNRLDTVRGLADLGIPSYSTDPHTVADILSSTQRLADLLGAPESGAAITRDLQRRLSETHRRLAALPQRRVLFVVWTEPLISIGKDTFIADALLHAGAVSIIDSRTDWPQISLEEVVHEQPEFLIFPESHSSTAPPDLDALVTRPGWRILDAVKSHRYALVSDAVNRPATRIVSAIEDLARQLHPEAFTPNPEGAPKSESPKSAPPTPGPNTFLRSSSPSEFSAANRSALHRLPSAPQLPQEPACSL